MRTPRLQSAIVVLTAMLVLRPVADAEWKPAVAPLIIRWAKEVTPENVWPEYPRPQMVRAEWQSLNGLWDYAIAGEGGDWKQPNVENAAYDPLSKSAPTVPARWNGQILVPFAIESALSGVGKLVRPNQLLWYRRAFDLPAAWKGRRIVGRGGRHPIR